MLPLKDNIPTMRFPIVTVILIAVNLLVFLYEMSLGTGVDDLLTRYGMTPYEITSGDTLYYREGWPPYITLITSMFLHAGILHVGGNMLFLWIFGNNVEDSMGRIRFVGFYLLCGLIASAGQIVIEPSSQVPNVGASGAIAGVMGGYILLYPRAKVTTLVFLGIFITFIELPAMLVLLFWITIQVAAGLSGLYSPMAGGGVAYFAHIGGFVAGLAAIKIFTFGKKRVRMKQSYM